MKCGIVLSQLKQRLFSKMLKATDTKQLKKLIQLMAKGEEKKMKNVMNEKTKLFIEKLQKTASELYDEYSCLDMDGIVYYCPLEDIMISLQEICCMDTEDIVKEYDE